MLLQEGNMIVRYQKEQKYGIIILLHPCLLGSIFSMCLSKHCIRLKASKYCKGHFFNTQSCAYLYKILEQ